MRKIEVYQRLIKRLYYDKAELIEFLCPGEVFTDNLVVDFETETFNEDGFTIGCRGMTCAQCWEQEF